MSRKNKKGRKKNTLEKIILATAVIQLLQAVISLVNKIVELLK